MSDHTEDISLVPEPAAARLDERRQTRGVAPGTARRPNGTPPGDRTRANGWTFPGFVRTSLDARLRSVEVDRAIVE